MKDFIFGTDNRITRRMALKRMGVAMAGALAYSSGLLSLTSCDKKDMKRVILYFTGTGNCLYVARQLGGRDAELLSIPQMMSRQKFDIEADETISSWTGWNFLAFIVISLKKFHKSN